MWTSGACAAARNKAAARRLTFSRRNFASPANMYMHRGLASSRCLLLFASLRVYNRWRVYRCLPVNAGRERERVGGRGCRGYFNVASRWRARFSGNAFSLSFFFFFFFLETVHAPSSIVWETFLMAYAAREEISLRIFFYWLLRPTLPIHFLKLYDFTFILRCVFVFILFETRNLKNQQSVFDCFTKKVTNLKISM